MKIRQTALLCLLVTVSGCNDTKEQAKTIIPEIGYYQLASQDITLETDLPGRTTAYRIAEVRPQVSGIIQKRWFEEGSDVKEGKPLYLIDPATYVATHERTLAAYNNAKRLYNRYHKLESSMAVSKQVKEDAYYTMLQAGADVKSAAINVEYTKVLAPISGRIGRSSVTEGALVTNGQNKELAVIQQIDPIYVDVTQSVSEMLKLRKKWESGELEHAGGDVAKVGLKLPDGEQYKHSGTLKFSEISVEPSTGNVTIRAQFPNPDKELLPGMFVHARISEGERKQGILVPQQAVARDITGKPFVWMVNDDDTISMKNIQTERTIGNAWLLNAGLNIGDKVVVEGLQKAQEGMSVIPKLTQSIKFVQSY